MALVCIPILYDVWAVLLQLERVEEEGLKKIREV